MNVNAKSIAALMRAIEKSTLSTYDLRLEDSDEFIIRYETMSFRTISIYFTWDNQTDDYECIIGWLDQEGVYHSWAWLKILSARSRDQFLIDLTCQLYSLEHYEEV